jgi:hypothetical protein
MSYETASPNDRELQKTMYLIIELLGMLRRCRRDRRHSCRIQKEISTVTERVEFLMPEQEYTIHGSVEQKPDLIKLGARPLCRECLVHTVERRRDREIAEPTIVPPPIWQRALEFALECTCVVASESFRDYATGTLTNLPSCLSRLRSVLWRLQGLLPPVRAEETKLVVQSLPGKCGECGQAIEAS